jgi:hypothetical protein
MFRTDQTVLHGGGGLALEQLFQQRFIQTVAELSQRNVSSILRHLD